MELKDKYFRIIEITLLIVMVAGFIYSSQACYKSKIASYKKSVGIAIEECGTDPCNIPQQYRPKEYKNATCDEIKLPENFTNISLK